MENIIIKTEPGYFYITPVGFFAYAKDFHSAGVQWKTERNYSPVPYFLFCRSIELGLKAFVLAKGEKLSFVRKRISHDIYKAFKRALHHSLESFLITTESERKEIIAANKYYSDKGFEYFSLEIFLGSKSDLPDLQILRQYSEKLLEKTEAIILRST
jgi:hypothetical protein